MRKAARSAILVLGGLIAEPTVLTGCEAEDDCTPGTEACPCTSDSRCLQGLTCLSSYCVNANAMPTSGSADAADAADGGGFDNVAACEAFVDSVSCGDVDISQFLDCSIYANTTCDIADYFNCLADATTCTDGIFDNSGWPECMDLATCA